MRRIGIIAAALLVAALLAWAVLHVFISPVNPAQAAPEGHYNAACWSCHMVLDSAPLAD